MRKVFNGLPNQNVLLKTYWNEVKVFTENHELIKNLKGLCKQLKLAYIPFSQTGSDLLFNVIAECYEKQSLMITTNLQFKEWESILGSNKLTAAIINRLIHHGHIISFSRTSYRLKKP